jgi:hypothetical protein
MNNSEIDKFLTDAVEKTKEIRRVYWVFILVNLFLGLVGTALMVGIVGAVILGLLKLFGVI